MIPRREYVKYFLPLFLVILASIIIYFIITNENKYLKVVFLDIGQGDAIFIQTPNKKQMLIDSGNGNQILPKLYKIMPLFDKSIDILVITNPDQDHIGGFQYVIKEFKIGMILEPGTNSETLTYENLEKIIEEKKINRKLAKRGMKIVLDKDIHFDVLFPDRDVSDWERNDGSLVAKLSYLNSTFMLMGDGTKYTEYLIRENENDKFLESDILKLGHHGSHTSSSLLWLETVKPEFAIVSAGKNNKFGHPSQDVISNLNSLGIKYLETFKTGNIKFKTDGDKIKSSQL